MDDRAHDVAHEVRTSLDEARAEVGERFRETTMRLTASGEVQHELSRVHAHLDALSKEQVSRTLEIGKLHDRLVRLEMRMGDVLKEQEAHQAAQHDVVRRIGELDQAIGESVRGVQYVHGQVEGAAADGRATDTRLTTLMAARNGDHDELTRLANVLGSIQHTLRQVDLRLGDLGERYTDVRDELANLSARVSNLELAPTRPVSATELTGRTEGH
jgi:chromosome segregation ATPase